jgi:uncharacterized membrane protein YfcA
VFNQEILILIVSMLAAGSLAGLVAGLFGIGGGLVVVPTLITLFTWLKVAPEHIMYLALGTSLSTVIVTSLRSTQAHYKKGSVDFSLIKSWAPYVALGVLIGVIGATNLRSKTLIFCFAGFISVLAFKFIFPNIFKHIKFGDSMPEGIVKYLLGIFLGSSSALFGIGGGSIVVMIMTFFGRSIHQGIGTASGFGVLIATLGTLSYMVAGMNQVKLPFSSIGYVNLIAFISIICTSSFTAPLGAKLAHKLDPMVMKRIFGVYLLFTAGLMFWKNL